MRRRIESATWDARADVSGDSRGACASIVAAASATMSGMLSTVAFNFGFYLSVNLALLAARQNASAADYCRASRVEASASPHAGVTPPSMIRKLSSGNDPRLTVRTIGTGEDAVRAALSALSLRKRRTPSLATADRAHTSIGDLRLAAPPVGESRNLDSAATNAAASSWCAN